MRYAIPRALGLALALGLAGTVAIRTAAAQQAYPAKPIRVIVPYPPGDAVDILSRLIGPKVSERLGQQMIVENRAGASGQIGLEIAARAPADGYTVAVGGLIAENVQSVEDKVPILGDIPIIGRLFQNLDDMRV